MGVLEKHMGLVASITSVEVVVVPLGSRRGQHKGCYNNKRNDDLNTVPDECCYSYWCYCTILQVEAAGE